MARILSGAPIAKRILTTLKKKRKKNLCLCVIQVGNNVVSERYIKEKEKIIFFEEISKLQSHPAQTFG